MTELTPRTRLMAPLNPPFAMSSSVEVETIGPAPRGAPQASRRSSSMASAVVGVVFLAIAVAMGAYVLIRGMPALR